MKSKKNENEEDKLHKQKHPHDHFFRLLFSKKSVARDYIRKMMPKDISKNIDLRTLKIEKDSFVDEKLKEHFADIVYHCVWKKDKTINICLLFEHKSTPPKYPHFQLMRYILNSWENDLAQKRKPRIVIPIIFYHGKRKWRHKTIPQYFGIDKESILYPFIPQFEYHLTDLAHYSDEQILRLGINFLKNGLFLFKHYKNKKHLLNNIHLIFTNVYKYKGEEGRKFVESMFRYIIETISLNQEEIDSLFEKLKTIEPMALSTYDRIVKENREIGREEGKEIGREEGKEIGREEKQNLIIKKCIIKFPQWKNKQIADFVEANVDLVKKIREQMKNNHS